MPAVTLLKCDYARLSSWKVVSWEASSTDGATLLALSNGTELMKFAVYPHLYAQLEGENVESSKELVRGGEPGKEEDWKTVLQRARVEGWLQA